MSVPIVRTSPEPDLYTPGGPLNVTDPIYVSRTADRELLDAIRRGQFCFILTPRQMGKSSLMYRTAANVRSLGIRSVVVDLTAIGGEANADQWYLGHLTEIVTQLHLKTDYLAWWEKARHLSAVQRFGKFLTEVVLTEVAEPVIIFVDEIDTTLKLSYSDDYFAAIRSLYNKRAAEPELNRLTFVLLGVASPSDLIKDAARTPFNIGQRIHLTDFQSKEAYPLGAGLSPNPALSQKLLDRILSWTGGHPYLTQTACKRVAQWASEWDPKYLSQSVDQLIDNQFFSERGRHTDANLQFVTERILEHETAVRMLRLYRRIRSGETVLDDELDPVRMTLKLSGLVKAGDGKVLQVRNRIYERVFDETWARSELARRGESSDEQETGIRSLIPKFLRGASRFKYDVFIAYASRDSEWVVEYLVPNLERAGLTVFIDFRSVSPGENFNKQLELAIEDSRSVILVLSPAFLSSVWAMREMELAVRLAGEDKNERRIIPLVLRKVEIPSPVRYINGANFTEKENWSREMARLFEALGAPNKVSPLEVSGGTQTSTESKDTGIIRQLLDSAFDEEELLTFAYDYFRPVYAEMEPGLSKRMRIQMLIESAERDSRLDYLLDQVARARPNEYRQFSQRFEMGPSAGTV